MKQIKLIIFIIVVLLLALISTANSQEAGKICFSVEDSKRLVVELERGRILEQQIVLLEKTNSELIKQTELLKEQVNLVNEKFKAAENLVSKNEELYKQKEKALNEELEQAKKTRWKSLFVAGGVGSAITALVILGLVIGL